MIGRFVFQTSVASALLWNPVGHAAYAQSVSEYVACVLNEGKKKVDSSVKCEGAKKDGLNVQKPDQDPPKVPTPACPKGSCGPGVSMEEKTTGLTGKGKNVPNQKEMNNGYKNVAPGSKYLSQ